MKHKLNDAKTVIITFLLLTFVVCSYADEAYLKVQIGAFRKPIKQSLYKDFPPVTKETAADGLTRYTVGYFTSVDAAKVSRDELRRTGYPDAFIVGFEDGKLGNYANVVAKLKGNANPPVVAADPVVTSSPIKPIVLPPVDSAPVNLAPIDLNPAQTTPVVVEQVNDEINPAAAIARPIETSPIKTDHWYFGASTGFFKPDGSYNTGTTRMGGGQIGYQFDEGKWSIELSEQRDLGGDHNYGPIESAIMDYGPNSGYLDISNLNLVRYWGDDDLRFFVELGYIRINYIPRTTPAPEDTISNGLQVGLGVSKFITENWEVRGDLKVAALANPSFTDSMASASLNYHFVQPHAVCESDNQ